MLALVKSEQLEVFRAPFLMKKMKKVGNIIFVLAHFTEVLTIFVFSIGLVTAWSLYH